MYSVITTGALSGVQAYFVRVEVDASSGLPSFNMVGLPGSEVRESRERVCVALKNAGFDLPPLHITVNLSPADQRKAGAAFDLPIAVGLLEAMGCIPPGASGGCLFLGELGLNGEIRTVPGVLPIVRWASEQGIKQFFVPAGNAAEGAVIPTASVRGVGHIREVIAWLLGDEEQRQKILTPVQIDLQQYFKKRQKDTLDFSQVRGQTRAKRAAQIAAAGFHSMLMYGPPGVGKSMIASRLPGILPPLSVEESLEVSSIYSAAGLLQEPLITQRPFQNPHHTITDAGMLGGGSHLKPGIISLAHKGVLFLDELAEFRRGTLDSLRQPLEEKVIHIDRANGGVAYPADFMLVCAMNPCPCGYYPDRNRCKCTESMLNRYRSKISGPILDRIDLCVELDRLEIGKLQEPYPPQESSASIRERVLAARKCQEERYAGEPYHFNAQVPAADLDQVCRVSAKEKELLDQLYRKLRLSARSYYRLVRISRTIADLEEARDIRERHIREAACYRML